MGERRGFFDEIHQGEIDPGYFYLLQNGVQVGELWANGQKLDVLLFGNYLTPGKVVPSGSGNVTNPDIYTETVFVSALKDKNGNPIAPSIQARVLALTGKQEFTQVHYDGIFVKYSP